MEPTRKLDLTGLFLKFLTIAVAAAAVYVADTLPDRASAGNAHAASPAVTDSAPRLAVAPATERWSADESATGTSPDAAH